MSGADRAVSGILTRDEVCQSVGVEGTVALGSEGINSVGGELDAALQTAGLFALVLLTVSELCVVDEDDLVASLPVEGEQILEDSERPEVGDLGCERLTDLADDRVTAGLAEFDPPADRYPEPLLLGGVEAVDSEEASVVKEQTDCLHAKLADEWIVHGWTLSLCRSTAECDGILTPHCWCTGVGPRLSGSRRNDSSRERRIR